MLRRIFVYIFRRSIIVLILICLGCSAQSAPPELARNIERHVRAYYAVPAEVHVNITAPKASDFPGYDSIVVSFANGEKKQDYDFLVSKDGKTLLRMTKLDLSTDPYAEVMKKIDIQGRPVRGNKDARVTVVSYDDFQCPYCSVMHQTMFPQILNEYGDKVAFIYKDFPIAEIHPWSTRASVNANCLAAQNPDAYWTFADYVHANQREVNGEKGTPAQFAKVDLLTMQEGQKRNLDLPKLQACIKAQKDDLVKASLQEGDKLGVDATPTMYVNGQKVNGALPLEELRTILDQALKDAGVAPPVHPAAGTQKTGSG